MASRSLVEFFISTSALVVLWVEKDSHWSGVTILCVCECVCELWYLHHIL